MDAPLWLWFAVLGAALVVLLVDLVAHRHAHVASLIATRGQARRAVPALEHPPFRVATEEEVAATSSAWRRSPATSTSP